MRYWPAVKRLLTLILAATACTSLPNVEPAPVGDGGTSDAGVDACAESLALRLPQGAIAARGDVLGTGLAYVEVATLGPTATEPAIAWVGKCPPYQKAAIYITKQSSLKGGDLCAGADRFGDSSFDAPSDIKPVRLIPNDRVPTFICAVSAASTVPALPEVGALVSCFGNGRADVRVLLDDFLIAAFRSTPLSRSSIRLVYTNGSSVVTRLIDDSSGTLIASTQTKVRDVRPDGESASTSGFSPDLLTDEATNEAEGFLEVAQQNDRVAQFLRYRANGAPFKENTPFELTTNGVAAPRALSFGETGTVPIASLLGFEGGTRTKRAGVIILNPRGKISPTKSQTITYAVDLNSQTQLAALGAESGYLEKFAFASSVDLSAGAALVIVRGIELGSGKDVSAVVKLGSPQLASATADNAAFVPEKIPPLPRTYGMAIGTSGRGLQTTSSGYLAIRSEDAVNWTERRCERGVVAAFPVSLK